jgi:hypothetical protein
MQRWIAFLLYLGILCHLFFDNVWKHLIKSQRLARYPFWNRIQQQQAIHRKNEKRRLTRGFRRFLRKIGRWYFGYSNFSIICSRKTTPWERLGSISNAEFPQAAPPPRQIRILMRMTDSRDAGLFAAPSSHFTIRSRSFQPIPVEVVPPRSPQPWLRTVRPEGGAANAPTGRDYQPTKTHMTYIEQFEAELLKKLNGNEDDATIVRWTSERVLESYRNGITAGEKGAKVIRKGESRRGNFPSKAR